MGKHPYNLLSFEEYTYIYIWESSFEVINIVKKVMVNMWKESYFNLIIKRHMLSTLFDLFYPDSWPNQMKIIQTSGYLANNLNVNPSQKKFKCKSYWITICKVMSATVISHHQPLLLRERERVLRQQPTNRANQKQNSYKISYRIK